MEVRSEAEKAILSNPSLTETALKLAEQVQEIAAEEKNGIFNDGKTAEAQKTLSALLQGLDKAGVTPSKLEFGGEVVWFSEAQGVKSGVVNLNAIQDAVNAPVVANNVAPVAAAPAAAPIQPPR